MLEPDPPEFMELDGEGEDTASRLLPGGAWLQVLGLTVWPVLALESESPLHCTSDIRRKKTNPILIVPCEDMVKSKPPFHESLTFCASSHHRVPRKGHLIDGVVTLWPTLLSEDTIGCAPHPF